MKCTTYLFLVLVKNVRISLAQELKEKNWHSCWKDLPGKTTAIHDIYDCEQNGCFREEEWNHRSVDRKLDTYEERDYAHLTKMKRSLFEVN